MAQYSRETHPGVFAELDKMGPHGLEQFELLESQVEAEMASVHRHHPVRHKNGKPKISEDHNHNIAVAQLAWLKHVTPLHVAAKQDDGVAESSQVASVSLANKTPISLSRRYQMRAAWWVEHAAKIVIVLLLLLLAVRAHAQVDSLHIQTGGADVKSWAGGVARLNFPSNMTCSFNAGTKAVDCTPSGAVGSVAWDAITNPAAGGLSLTQFANGNDFLSVTRKTDTLPTGNFLRFKNAAASDLFTVDITGAALAASYSTSGTNGGFDGLEGTGAGLTAAASHDLFWADSVAHRWKMNNNNGGAVQVVVSGVDINTSDQVTATHLAAALPVAQGGTGTVSTLTGVVRGGSPMTASELSGDATTLGSNAVTLATKYKTSICTDGLGDGLNAITAGTYTVTNCFNDFGATYTITGIRCFTDNSGSSTLNAANDAATGLLTGAVTCTNAFASGTQSGTTTIATSHWINFTFVADGTSKRATFEVTVTR